MNDLAISVQNLQKIYQLYDKPIDRMKEALSLSRKNYHKQHYALNNLTFEVKKGETIGIIGTNGAGKSTLLKIITGVLTPTSGNVIVNGKISALLELGAGFNPEYTGLENIYLNGTMMGLDEKQIKEKIPSVLAFADIGEFINQPVKTYSSGMFARLAFAVAVNVEPEILIVDETLSVGDVRFQIKCMQKMKQMMQNGVTVLFVTHDINAIRRFCTRAIWINQGVIKEIGEVNTVADHYLDFLKLGEVDKQEAKIEEMLEAQAEEEELGPFTPNNGIAEVVRFRLLNSAHIPVDQIGMNEEAFIEVVYDVYETNIEHPVLGIAIRGMDDDYVCGINTLLDQKEIPWEYGRNKVTLEYIHGVLAVGGEYYFDVALFEETATVAIQYITMIKKFSVMSEYKGEGRYIIPHRWEI